jgi:hypothetical protein
MTISIHFPASPGEPLAVFKAMVVRIGTNGTRQGFKLAEAIFRAYPELRGA